MAKGKYKLTNDARLSAKYYARRYNEWQREYNACKDSVKAINYDGMPHGSNITDPTEQLAERRVRLRQKMEFIEQAAIEADAELYRFILKYACDGVSYEHLNAFDGLYVSARTFRRKVHKFYFFLANKI